MSLLSPIIFTYHFGIIVFNRLLINLIVLQVKFIFVYGIQKKGSSNPLNDINNLKYTPNVVQGLKDDILVNYILGQDF